MKIFFHLINFIRKQNKLIVGLLILISFSFLVGIFLYKLILAPTSLKLSTEQILNRVTQLETANEIIKDKFAKIENNFNNQLHNNKLALALLHLRDITQTHATFIAELNLVRQLLMPQHQQLKKILAMLEPYATTGVATVAELRDGFGLILVPKLQTSLAEDNDKTWINWAINWLNILVIPFFSPQPNPRQQLVILATDRLTEDNLRGAVELIERLDGTAADIVVRWLKEANARLTVDAAYNFLSGITVELLGQS